MQALVDLAWPVRLVALAAIFYGTAAALTLVGFAVEARLKRSRIFALPLAPGQRRRELGNAVVFLGLLTLAAGLLLGAGIVDWSGGGWGAGLGTFFACWFAFDVYYYAMHRALHTRALIRLHREHHLSHVTTPLTAFSTSVPECLGWIVGYALVPLTFTALGLAVHPIGFAAYLFYNFFGNVIGHLNCELIPAALATRAQTWTAHPIVYHSLHHARYTGHYSFCATFMDRLGGSEWRDWPDLHARVLAGDALTSLKQRGRE